MTNFGIWLVRHGETLWSRTGQHTGRTDLPQTGGGRARLEPDAMEWDYGDLNGLTRDEIRQAHGPAWTNYGRPAIPRWNAA